MIPKVLTALLSAALLSALLGSLPCEATGAKNQGKRQAATTTSGSGVTSDLNSPAVDFSGVTPVRETPHPDLIPPKKDKNQFFDQDLR